MKNHPYLSMFAVVALSAITLLVLLYRSTAAHGTNGFSRNFEQPFPITPIDTLNIEFDSYYIAGHSNTQLYLGNLVAPRNLLVIESNRLDTQHVFLTLENPKQLKFWNVMVKIDSPHVYLVDGAVPAIFHGTLKSRFLNYLGEGVPYFLDCLPMHQNAFAIRSISKEHEGELGKVTLSSFSTAFHPQLLEKQGDGIFCTEGMLHYNKQNNTLLYLYTYRNQFLVMDSSLQLLYRGQTIDTISIAQIKVASISSTHSTTMASPPLMVNYHSTLWNDFLLVHSALSADNEKLEDFEQSSVIDVYSVGDGKYNFSFYIPNHLNKSLRNFRIVGNRLMVLYERNLVSYAIPERLKQLSVHAPNTE